MIIIDGRNAILGRMASYAAKQLLRGEEVIIVNSDEVIVTGNKKNIREEFLQTRRRVGTAQKGPKISRSSEKIVKRAVRGMLPDHREGRGKEALERIKCYNGIPKQFENSKKISAGKEKGDKFVKVKDIFK